MSRGTLRRAAFGSLAGTGALLLALGAAGPALAHSRLASTDPADGAVLARAPAELTLIFNEHPQGRFSTVVVTGPGGSGYAEGPPRVIDSTLRQPVYPMGSGAYTVAWRVVATDGHPVQGEFHFTVRLASGQEPTAGPPAAVRSGTPAAASPRWPWAAGGVVLVIGAVAGLLAIRRRRRT